MSKTATILFALCTFFCSACSWVDDDQSDCPTGCWLKLSYTYNIANADAARLYASCGLPGLSKAYEKGGAEDLPQHPADLIMQCRHCLRYALGYCVRRGGKRPQWREPLHLVLPDGRQFRLEFDCQDCKMNVYAEK